jgi:environmental stress-induced protein Ves
MTWHITTLADTVPSPWKNGGGVTRELVAWPNAQDWVWRMSVAEVARSGPFSRFDGVQRWFAVLSGAGVRLDVGAGSDVAAHTLTPTSTPLCFEGELPVQCTVIDGLTQDFNLMLRRDRISARMLRVHGDYSVLLDDSKTIAAYSILTWASVYFKDECLDLPPNTLAWRQCPAGSRLQVSAAQALWMEIG